MSLPDLSRLSDAELVAETLREAMAPHLHVKELCCRLSDRPAAPPPAGALHPLALVYLEMGARGGFDGRVEFAWREAGCPIYTAAPPALSAEGAQIKQLADFILASVPGEPSRDYGAVDCAIAIITKLQAEVAHAARAPVTPTPEPEMSCHVCGGAGGFTQGVIPAGVKQECPHCRGSGKEPDPATVERCNHQRFKHVPGAELFCSMPKGHTGLHRWENWTWPQDPDDGPTSLDAPASPPARPPAVTREEFDAIVRQVAVLANWMAGELEEHAVGMRRTFERQMQEAQAEARRDADRRETR